jgi:hypothetical protein
MRGNYQISLELAERLLPLAQGQQDPTLLIEACLALGENLHFLGELTSAQSHLEQGIALYDSRQRCSLVLLQDRCWGNVVFYCSCAIPQFLFET